MQNLTLIDLGWSDFFQSSLDDIAPHHPPLCQVGRVSARHRSTFEILTPAGEFAAELTGRYAHDAFDHGDYPEAGDWVLYMHLPGETRLLIVARLDRRGIISRAAAGRENRSQIAGVNLDKAFIVTGLDGDFNLRRIERYLTTIRAGGIDPILVFTKADLCADWPQRMTAVKAIAPEVPIHVVSHPTGEGYDDLKCYFDRGITGALIGSSGAGKSTIINHLMGENVQKTGGVRGSDDRGKHTTTARRLLLLPQKKGLILDSPGIRQVGLWSAQGGLDSTFDDLKTLAEDCRYTNCSHQSEPGCAVLAAIDTGALDPGRLINYQKLEKELAYQDMRLKEGSERASRLRGKAFAKMAKSVLGKKRWKDKY